MIIVPSRELAIQIEQVFKQMQTGFKINCCYGGHSTRTEKHNLSEIHREIGATYLEAGQYEDARRELAIYLERRPYDSEGLFHYAQALEKLGEVAEAREMDARAIEAARTAPRYRRRYTAKWSRLAQKQAQAGPDRLSHPMRRVISARSARRPA